MESGKNGDMFHLKFGKSFFLEMVIPKQHFQIQFYFLNGYNATFDIGFEKQDSEIIFDLLLYVFGAKFDIQEQKINLDYKLQCNKQFQERLDWFIDKYKHCITTNSAIKKKIRTTRRR